MAGRDQANGEYRPVHHRRPIERLCLARRPSAMRRLLSACVGLAALGATLGAQAPDASFAFEAASVKPNKSASGDSELSPNRGTGFVVTNMTLARLITSAYQLQRFQLEGGPPWLTTDRFDIVARYRPDAPPASPGGPVAWMLALRALFADRFNLEVHWETRQVPIYAIVLARRDGKLGPAIGRAATDCEARAKAAAAVVRSGGPAPPPVNTEARMACGIRNTGDRILFGGNPLPLLAQGLSNIVQRPVVDRTGLTGNWDFVLTFTPEQQRARPEITGADSNGPSIFTAMEEQLGLKLEATTGPVQVLVVDRAEWPAPD
jgi:uncharacterized protein (TIGR03435 family)